MSDEQNLTPYQRSRSPETRRVAYERLPRTCDNLRAALRALEDDLMAALDVPEYDRAVVDDACSRAFLRIRDEITQVFRDEQMRLLSEIQGLRVCLGLTGSLIAWDPGRTEVTPSRVVFTEGGVTTHIELTEVTPAELGAALGLEHGEEVEYDPRGLGSPVKIGDRVVGSVVAVVTAAPEASPGPGTGEPPQDDAQECWVVQIDDFGDGSDLDRWDVATDGVNDRPLIPCRAVYATEAEAMRREANILDYDTRVVRMTLAKARELAG